MSRSERMLNDMSAETSSLLRSKKDVSMKEIYLKCKILSGFNTYHHGYQLCMNLSNFG
jgi:hypothetical protein